MFTTKLDEVTTIWCGRNGKTHQEVAEYLGMGRTTWQNKRLGRYRMSAEELWLLSDLLGKPMEYVYQMLPPINHTTAR